MSNFCSMRKFSLLILLVEIIMISAVGFTSISLANNGELPFAMTPNTFAKIVILAYIFVACAVFFYICSAFLALIDKPYLFWSTYAPAMLGIPLCIWAAIKTFAEGYSNIIGLEVVFSCFIGCLIGTFISWMPDILRRIIPLTISFVCYMTLDYESIMLMHFCVGFFLLIIPFGFCFSIRNGID